MDMFGLGILLNAKDQASASIFRVNTALQELTKTLRNTSNVSQTEMKVIKDSINSSRTLINEGLGLGLIGKEIMGFSNAIISPLAQVGQQAIQTGSQFEQWRMTLEALYKDSELAKEKLQWGMNLAAQTPFEVTDVTEALIGFKAVGAEADTMFTNANGQARSFLEYMGDLASLRPDIGLQGVLLGVRNLLGGDGGKSLRMRMDIDFEQILGRDFGSTSEEIMKDLVEVSDKLANGLMTKLEGTWGQMISNLKDQSTRFFLAISDGGAFNKAKSSLKYVSDAIGNIDDDRLKKIGENIASAFNLILKPIDFVVRKLVDFAMGVIKLMEVSPLFSKLVVGFISIVSAGALVVGTLVTLAGIIIIVKGAMSLLSPFISILRLKFLTFTSSLVTMLPQMLLIGGALGLIYTAWKNDFGGLKTTLTNFMTNIHKAFTYSSEISKMGVNEMLESLKQLDTTTFGGWLTYRLTQLKVLWMGVVDAWNDYTLSDENFVKLRELGLLPLLQTILDIKRRAEAFFEGFKTGWENVSKVVGTVVSTIVQTIEKIVTALFPVKGHVEDVNDTVGKTDFSEWKDFGETLAYIVTLLGGLAAINKVTTVLSGFGKIIGGAFSGVWKIVSGIPTAFKIVGKVAMGLLGVLGSVVTSILGFFGIVVGLPAWVVGAITLAIVGIVALIITKWDEIKEYTSKVWKAISDKTSEVWGGIVDWYNDNIKPMTDNIAQWFNDLKDKVSKAWGDTKQAFTDTWNSIKSWYEQNIKPWTDIIAKLWEVFSAVFKAAMTEVGKFFKGVWDDIVQWYNQTIESWKQAAIQKWEDFKTRINAIFYVVSEWFKQQWADISAWYDTNIQPWIDIIQQKWSEFTNTLNNLFNEVKSYFTEQWSEIQSWYNDNIKPWIDGAIEGWNMFTNALSGVWDTISEAWHRGLGDLYSWATNKVNGLIELANKLPGINIDLLPTQLPSDRPTTRMSGNMVGLSTGGYVKTEGIAMLHPNEVVVNDPITQRLKSFLDEQETRSIIRNTPQPVEDSKTVTVNNITLAQTQPQNQPRSLDRENRLVSSVANTTSIDRSTRTEKVDQSIKFENGSIQINMTDGNPQEIESLAKQIAMKIQRELELRNTLNYRPSLT